MKILNVGCGAMRLPPPFVNLDCLREFLFPGTPERQQLDQEPNYVEHKIGTKPMPFPENTFDGLALLHCLEHFSAQAGLALLEDCLRVLKHGSSILVSVPDASYFRRVHDEDRNENWPRLFDVSDPPNPIPTFFSAALWFNEHEAILTEDAVWAYLQQAGFACIERISAFNYVGADVVAAMHAQLNRRKFSLVVIAKKP